MKHLFAAVVLIISIGIFLERAAQTTAVRPSYPFKLLQMQFREPDKALLMPVQGVSVTRVANTWGAPRPGRRNHQGQDIFARRGTPVVSATDGIVVRVGTNPLGGNVVSVMGNGGRLYYYAHLQGYAENLAAGDEVLAGDVLGYVGNTGNARTTPPHLHFGVYTATGAVDPLPLLRAAVLQDTTPRSTVPQRSQS